ncbi:hypothetical protein Tco_0709504, partial [Tanacetum coccineum]
DAEAPMEDQPLPDDASPTTHHRATLLTPASGFQVGESSAVAAARYPVLGVATVDA